MLVGIRLVVLDLGAAGFVTDCAEAETHFLLFHIDLDDLELVLHACFKLGSTTGIVAGFGDVAETLNALGDFNESAELSGAEHLAVNHVADAMGGEEALPNIGLK